MNARAWFGIGVAVIGLLLILVADSPRFSPTVRRVAASLGVALGTLLLVDGFFALDLLPGSWGGTGVILLGIQIRALWRLRLAAAPA